jgi:hypothetical protein
VLIYSVGAYVRAVFVLDDFFPNNDCMLAICNIQFYSLRFSLSNLFGIFRFELKV